MLLSVLMLRWLSHQLFFCPVAVTETGATVVAVTETETVEVAGAVNEAAVPVAPQVMRMSPL